MKKLSFDKLSNKVCAHPGCIKRLKQRIVEDKPTATLCYDHYKIVEATRDHGIDCQPRRKRLAAELPVKNYA